MPTISYLKDTVQCLDQFLPGLFCFSLSCLSMQRLFACYRLQHILGRIILYPSFSSFSSIITFGTILVVTWHSWELKVGRLRSTYWTMSLEHAPPTPPPDVQVYDRRLFRSWQWCQMPLSEEGESGTSSCSKHLAWAGLGCHRDVSVISWVVVFLWKEGLQGIFHRSRERQLWAFESIFMVLVMDSLTCSSRCSSDNKRGRTLDPTSGRGLFLSHPHRHAGPVREGGR